MNNRPVPYYAIHTDGLISGFFGDFDFLSNFYICNNGVWMGEIAYPSVEHAYQAAKYPENQRSQFVGVTSAQAKKLGNVAPNFNKSKWDKKKYELMYALCWSKFTKNLDLKDKLVFTDGYILEERNNWQDMDWGVNENGEGENNLGKILMKIRDKLKLQQQNNEW